MLENCKRLICSPSLNKVYCIVLYCIVLYCIVLYCIVLVSTLSLSTVTVKRAAAVWKGLHPLQSRVPATWVC